MGESHAEKAKAKAKATRLSDYFWQHIKFNLGFLIETLIIPTPVEIRNFYFLFFKKISLLINILNFFFNFSPTS